LVSIRYQPWYLLGIHYRYQPWYPLGIPLVTSNQPSWELPTTGKTTQSQYEKNNLIFMTQFTVKMNLPECNASHPGTVSRRPRQCECNQALASTSGQLLINYLGSKKGETHLKHLQPYHLLGQLFIHDSTKIKLASPNQLRTKVWEGGLMSFRVQQCS
jgi:hypothetical protein